MSETLADVNECRIAFDDAYWATRVGLLQIAVSESVYGWYSADSKYHYKLTPSYEPSEGVNYINHEGSLATLYDPDRVSPQGEQINPARWLIGRIRSDDFHTSPKNEARRTSRSVTFIVDEPSQRIGVWIIEKASDFNNPNNMHTYAPMQYVAELAKALEDLSLFLQR